jgi:hypothetical protein
MTNESDFVENSEAVQAHLSMSQNIIQRMAANSASCKGYCITLVSAILVLVADKGKPEFTFIALIPTILFLALDVYYLALERLFRTAYNTFIRKLHARTIIADDLYVMKPEGCILQAMFSCFGSFSVWPFYLTLAAMVFVTKRLVM